MQWHEAVLLEDFAGGLRAYEVHKLLCGPATVRGHSDWISDGRMSVFGKRGNDTDLLLGQRIRLIDDAQRRFPASNKRQCGTDILRADNLPRHLVPGAQLLQRGL